MHTTNTALIDDHAIRVVMATAQRRHTAPQPVRKSLRRRLQQELCPHCGTLSIELFHQWKGCPR